MKIIQRIIFGSALLFIAWWLTPRLHYNIHTVLKGEVYRSAELPKKELIKMVKQKQIKTIINLRNAHPKETWYEDEATIAKANGIHLYNVSLPAFDLPTRSQLIYLVDILNKAKPPILIHCRHGSDRTGLASAMVLILKNDSSIDDIEKQTSWRYLALSPHSVGKLVLPKYAKWLNSQHKLSTAKNFYTWLNTVYKKSNSYSLDFLHVSMVSLGFCRASRNTDSNHRLSGKLDGSRCCEFSKRTRLVY